MSLEKDFWSIFKTQLDASPDMHHQRIETGSTGRGIPDVNLCWRGVEVWVEMKVVQGRRVELRPEQVAWHVRRTRAGGRSWIFAREKKSGPRVGEVDRLYLWPGKYSVSVSEKGVEADGATVWDRVGRKFPWDEILSRLFGRDE